MSFTMRFLPSPSLPPKTIRYCPNWVDEWQLRVEGGDPSSCYWPAAWAAYMFSPCGTELFWRKLKFSVSCGYEEIRCHVFRFAWLGKLNTMHDTYRRLSVDFDHIPSKLDHFRGLVGQAIALLALHTWLPWYKWLHWLRVLVSTTWLILMFQGALSS